VTALVLKKRPRKAGQRRSHSKKPADRGLVWRSGQLRGCRSADESSIGGSHGKEL